MALYNADTLAVDGSKKHRTTLRAHVVTLSLHPQATSSGSNKAQ